MVPVLRKGSQTRSGRYAIRLTLPKRKFSAARPPTGRRLNRNGQTPIEVASLIEDISMRYYFKADRGLDVKSQTDQGIPLGVMIDVQLLVDGQMRHMRRFLLIPVGGGI